MHSLQKLLNRTTYFLLTSIGLFIIAYFLNRYVTDVTSPRYYARLIQNRIQQKEKDFQQITNDTALMGTLVDQRYSEATLQQMLDTKRGYGLFIYDETEFEASNLLFWNTQLILPAIRLPEDSMGSRFERLANGYYVHTAKILFLRNDRRLIAEALIPVMSKYNVETDALRKEFTGIERAIRQVDIAPPRTVTDFPVKSSSGQVLFYIQRNSLFGHPHNTWTILVVIAGFILLFLFLHQTSDYVGRRFGFWYGVLLLVGVVGIIRLITYGFPDLLSLRQFELFDPAIYGSSYVLSSLGDLLINSLLMCWIITFINRRFNISAIRPYPEPWKNWAALVASITALVLVTFMFASILQSMVSDAKISFNVTNFFSLVSTPYSFIAFVILGTIALSYFFMSQILLTVAGKMVGDRNYFMFIIAGGIGLLILTFTGSNAIVELNLYVLPWLFAFMWLMQQRIFAGLNFRLNVSEVLFWLFVFSFSMSAVIIFENGKIELVSRKLFAEKLALQADPGSERLLSVTLTYLDSNFLVQNFDRFHFQKSNTYLKDSIINRSLSHYQNRYNTRIFTFDSTGSPLYNDEQSSYDTLNTIFTMQGKKTAIPGLRYFDRSFDKFAYIFRREAKVGDKALGYLFVLSEPKNYQSEALTPELFRQTREMLPEYSSVYSYAIYDSTRNLIQNYNDYAFPTHLNPALIPMSEYERRRNGAFEELWYRPSSDKVVIIAKKSNSFIEAITLFAYLFSTFLFLLAFYRFSSLIIRTRFQLPALKQYWQLSIRSQIHSTIIMVTMLSFIVIGVATILFFINRYQRNNQDRLTRAMQIMVNQVQSHINRHNSFSYDTVFYEPVFSVQMEQLIQEISEVHGMDVNLYDTLGNLRITSTPDMTIYSSGVLSNKMNPLAYYRLAHLQQVQTVTDEQVGRLDYLSIYSPVRNDRGHAVTFLNVPSYSSQSELKQEISNFLVTVINLNAFIFLIAGGIALVITNRITSSFTLISQKMRDVNLRKANEAIEWRRDDEIGVLVKEYNKMVNKLDESAEALAKSEREGAWRQMARQVAHEIKNPLTPMKLSIQYLQKAIDNNSTDVKQLTTNVAKTLVEQIDHLSKIASDFSQFANIGNPKNEIFDLHEMLHSLTSLYHAHSNMDFSWNPVDQRVLIFADRTQLNRLFTNLLQNAVEASATRDRRIIRMNEDMNGEYITVSVADNGDGIPEQTQSRIFTPNFTTKTSGTGLGLAMSKGIVEQAKGEIWFVTKEGVGTTFYVKLPLMRSAN
jgi:two-component system nitrogen regulation sensor histidine kinase NtrY